MSRYARVAFTETVQEMQREQGSRPGGRALGSAVGLHRDPLGERETGFIRARDGFYLATVSETGWPYVQFRGGPAGFTHVLDEHTLGYADVRGNRQYITHGNLRTDDRVALFFMDYARRSRLKIFGHARTVDAEADPALADRLLPTRTEGRVERLVVIAVEAFDWNCPKHIPHRYSDADLGRTHDRLDEARRDNRALAEENALLRARLDRLGSGLA